MPFGDWGIGDHLPTKCRYIPVPMQGYEGRPFERYFFILHSPPAEAQEEELKAAEESPEPEEKAVETDGVEPVLVIVLMKIVGMSCLVPPVSLKGLLAHNASNTRCYWGTSLVVRL